MEQESPSPAAANSDRRRHVIRIQGTGNGCACCTGKSKRLASMPAGISGALQILFGLLCIAFQAAAMGLGDLYSIALVGNAYYSPVLWILSGSFVLAAACSKKICLIITSMVLNIISAVSIVPFISLASISLKAFVIRTSLSYVHYEYEVDCGGTTTPFGDFPDTDYDWKPKCVDKEIFEWKRNGWIALYSMIIAVGVLEGVVAIVSSTFGCRAMRCCRRENEDNIDGEVVDQVLISGNNGSVEERVSNAAFVKEEGCCRTSKGFKSKAAGLLGATQILLGILSIVFPVVGMGDVDYSSTGPYPFYTPVLWFVSGGLSLASAYLKRVGMIITSMIMNIISGVSTLYYIPLAVIDVRFIVKYANEEPCSQVTTASHVEIEQMDYYIPECNDQRNWKINLRIAMYCLILVVGILEGIVAVVYAILCCRSDFCCKQRNNDQTISTNIGLVQHDANITNVEAISSTEVLVADRTQLVAAEVNEYNEPDVPSPYSDVYPDSRY